VGYVERPQIRGRWSHAVLPDLALGGRGYCWPPLPLTGLCTHVTICPRGMTLLGVGGGIDRWAWRGLIATFSGNFKIKFQTYIFEIIFKDNFLGLMFVHTTSDVYLTLRFKFEIYPTNFREIITYPWPYINNVVHDQ
jgi:hypothetical protein